MDLRDVAYLTATLNRVCARDRGEFQQYGSLDWFVGFEPKRLHGHARAHDIDDAAVLSTVPRRRIDIGPPSPSLVADRDAFS
jgi:hypothetical protein